MRKHRLGGSDFAPIAMTQVAGALLQLLWRDQGLKGQAAHRFGAAIAEQALSTGIECADHTSQVGGDNRNLGCRIQHAAQLVMGIAQ
ncbi:hypothetical protein D3C78_912670 [compost metagenome]